MSPKVVVENLPCVGACLYGGKSMAYYEMCDYRGVELIMTDFNAKSKRAYNQKADNYDNTSDGRFTKKFKELLLSSVEISKNNFVLDVACGNGMLLKMFLEKTAINGFGIDISEKMIKNAMLNCPTMTFQVAGCEKIPFEKDSMDIITVSAAYHHFPSVDDFAKEASRVLKPKGKVYIAEIWLPFILRVLLNPFLPLTGAGDVKFYSTNEIIRTFEKQNFEVVKAEKQGNVQIIQMQNSSYSEVF